MANAERKERLVLLDAHAIIHRAYHALPAFASSKGEPTGALYGLASMLIRIIGDLEPDYLVAAYDLPKPTYRHEAYKDYKAGRPKADEELVAQLKRSRDVFAALGIPVYDKEGFEADDILGTIVERVRRGGGRGGAGRNLDIIIASGDMDTAQLVEGKNVSVFTLKKGLNDTVLYDEKAVRDRYGFPPALLPDFKGLAGDPSDNIAGVPGIGEKTAAALIQKFGTIEALYAALKKGKGALLDAGVKPRVVELLASHEEEAEFSKLLATIRRDAPIEFTLPDKPWRESVDLAQADALFSELEFRALPARFREALAGRAVKPPPAGEPPGAREFSPGETKNLPPEPELRETAVAFWLVNSNWADPSAEDIFTFARTRDWPAARAAVLAELARRNQTAVFEEIEKPLIPVVAAMERRGILIDAAYLKGLSAEYHRELARIEKEIRALAGEEFNVASPKQLGRILFEKLGLKPPRQKKTPGGSLSTRESELAKLRGAHPIVPLVFEYRELAKLLGTYIDTLPALADGGGRIHARFIQAGTTTGRMSSENPNMQNIPVKTELGRKIRHAFVAPPGFLLAAFDYSQIELRIAAFMSGDPKLAEIFKAGEDVHAAVAAAVFGVSLPDVTSEMRRRAKVINFGILYGMGVNALRANLETTREEAARFLGDYFRSFSTLAAYLDRLKSEAAGRGYTETFFGRRRYLEGFNSKLPYIRAEAERMAVNAPFQGTCADIIKIAMARVAAFLSAEGFSDGAHLLLQVHDELVYEVREAVLPRVGPKIKEIMEGVLSGRETGGVPLAANASVGVNWGEMKPWNGRGS